MRWEAGDRDNIEDRRGSGGGGGGGVVRAGGIGVGGLLLLLVLSWATGQNFFSLLDTGGGPPDSGAATGQVRTSPQEERLVDMMDAVMASAQDTWSELLGDRYGRTKLVLFRDATESGCGFAQSATGPFYCPADRKVYLDLGFFNELSQRFGAPGDFAQAYVVTHEVGHHVQNLLGLMGSDRGTGAHSASVAIELQADCFAGIWGHSASQGGGLRAGHVQLDPDDTEEALRAAASIGDDRLQKMATGHVMPERFTHGTSAQRVEWFRRGMDSGDPRACSTGSPTTLR